LALSFYSIAVYGRLPHPFHNVPFDAFMDFFNTNWWAFNEGRYLEWKSIYPPLTFAIAKVFVPKKCIGIGDPAALRACSSQVLLFFIPIYLYAAYLSTKIINKFNSFSLKRDQLFLFGAVLLSLPFLYTAERMNYLIVTYIFYCLYLTEKRGFLKYIYFGIAVNMKPYLILLSASYLIRRELKNFMYSIISPVIIFLIGKWIIKDRNSGQFLFNMFEFGQNLPPSFHGLNYQSSFSNALRYFYTIYDIDQSFALIQILLFLIPLVAVIQIRKNIKNMDIFELNFLIFLGILIATSSLGGYAMIFLIPFISLFMKKEYGIFIFMITLLIPFDLIFYQGALTGLVNSYFSNDIIDNSIQITTGSILRPLVLILILFLYSESIRRRNDFKKI